MRADGRLAGPAAGLRLAYPPVPVKPLLAVACAAVGAVAGPLLARVIARVPRKEPVFGGASTRVPPRTTMATSIAAAVLFGAMALRFFGDWVLPAYLVFAASLLVVSVIDLEHYLIPNRIVYPTIALALPLLAAAAALAHDWSRFVHALVGGAGAWAFLLVVHLVYPKGMGFGDVRLSFILGLYLGGLGAGHVFLGLFLGFLLGSVAGITLLVVRRRTRRDAIPFGPFLAAGAMIAVLFGDPIIRWYQG
jgi:leader peptidase (prepilin peptidase)/N-methyltransferase